MLSNEYVTGLDTANPASTSPKVVKLPEVNGLLWSDYNRCAECYRLYGRMLPNNVLAAEEAGVNAPLFSFTTESELESTIRLVAATIPESQINNSLSQGSRSQKPILAVRITYTSLTGALYCNHEREILAASDRPLQLLLVVMCVLSVQQTVGASPLVKGVFGADVPFGSATSLAIALGGNVSLSLTPEWGEFYCQRIAYYYCYFYRCGWV